MARILFRSLAAPAVLLAGAGLGLLLMGFWPGTGGRSSNFAFLLPTGLGCLGAIYFSYRLFRGFSGSLRDLRREKELLLSLLNAFRDGVFCINPTGEIVFRNRALDSRLLDERAVGMPYSRAIRNGDALEFVHRTLGARVKDGAEAPVELSFDTGGSYFRMTMVPVRVDGRMPDLFLFIVQDETQERTIQKLRQEFMENAAHELKTPVTSIRGYAETLLPRVEADPGQKFLTAILRNAQRMERLIDDMGTIASVESREYAFNPESIALPAFVNELGPLVSGSLSTRALTLNVSVPTDCTVFADPLLLEHALINLIANAARFAPEGSPVHVRARKHNAGLIVEVADAGPGVPLEFRDKVFERFFRIDRNRTREGGGTGLGLAIVRRIVRRHGGRVRVEEEPGGGALFRLYFPPEPSARPNERMVADSDQNGRDTTPP